MHVTYGAGRVVAQSSHARANGLFPPYEHWLFAVADPWRREVDEVTDVSGVSGRMLGGTIEGVGSPSPSRQAFGSMKTTEQPEQWNRPVGLSAPAPARSMTRR